MSAVLTLLTGCGPVVDDVPRIDRSSGPLADLRFQWSAGSSIDLLSGPAVPVRAYLESWGNAQAMGSLDYAYPGFEGAVGTNTAYHVPEGSYSDRDVFAMLLRPDEGSDSVRGAAVGNNRFRIHSVNRSGQTVTATVCNYRYGMAVQNENGTFSSVAGAFARDTGVATILVRLDASDSAPDLPPQSGPAVAPSDDVFGGWKITGHLSDVSKNVPGFAAAWPTYEDDAATCAERAPDPPDRRAFLIDGEHSRGDFPTSPPHPGWPVPN